MVFRTDWKWENHHKKKPNKNLVCGQWKGRKYYIDHNFTTCCSLPLEWEGLPPGQEWVESSEFETYCIDHTNKSVRHPNFFSAPQCDQLPLITCQVQRTERSVPPGPCEALPHCRILSCLRLCLGPCEIWAHSEAGAVLQAELKKWGPYSGCPATRQEVFKLTF